MFNDPMGGFMFNAMPIMFFIVFAIVIIGFIAVFAKGINEHMNNSKMPQRSMPARLIGKRNHTWGGQGDMSAHTSYYVTFELENGERIEFAVSGRFSGMHTEGDTGILTHQGTKFLDFERERF